MVRAMAKAIAETGDDVFSPVVVDNYLSTIESLHRFLEWFLMEIQ